MESVADDVIAVTLRAPTSLTYQVLNYFIGKYITLTYKIKEWSGAATDFDDIIRSINAMNGVVVNYIYGAKPEYDGHINMNDIDNGLAEFSFVYQRLQNELRRRFIGYNKRTAEIKDAR